MGIASSKSRHAAEMRGEAVIEPARDSQQEEQGQEQPKEDTEEENDDDDVSTCEEKNAYWHDDDADGSFEPRISLTWKGDPEETLSDWKIVLHCEDGEKKQQEKVYHVHRSVVALGERGCDYFARLFRSDFSENQQSTSHIHLRSCEYDAFDDMLSFIYHGKLRICYVMVLPLRFLARYFGIPALHKQVNTFLGENLTCGTALYYLQAASNWKEESLFQSALMVCAQRFGHLDINELNILPLDLFRAIVTCPDLQICDHICSRDDTCRCDGQLSVIVSRYLRSCPEKIAAQELLLLTDSTVIQCRMWPFAATHFVSLAKDLYPGATEEEKQGLKDLCHRCWQNSIPSTQGLLQIANSFADENWDEMGWSGRQLLVQLGHSLRTTEEAAIRNKESMERLESDLHFVEGQKRFLEAENIDLRRTKRRLLAGEDISDDEDEDTDDAVGDY